MPYAAPLPVSRARVVHGIPPVFGSSIDATAPRVYFDFQVVTQPKPGDPTTTQWAIARGYLGYGDAPQHPITVAGAATYPDLSDATWTDWTGVSGSVWFEASAVDLTQDTIVTQTGGAGATEEDSGVSINSTDQGGTFDPTEQAWQMDGKCYLDGTPDGDIPTKINQTVFKRRIATFAADDDGNLLIDQYRQPPLELFYGDVDGQYCIYPRPQ